MKIITNNVPRKLLCYHDIPAVKQSDFNYLETGEQFSPRFVKYKCEYHDTHEFMRVEGLRYPAHNPLKGWDGVQSDTYFSGVLFKWSDNYEYVIVGRYYS